MQIHIVFILSGIVFCRMSALLTQVVMLDKAGEDGTGGVQVHRRCRRYPRLQSCLHLLIGIEVSIGCASSVTIPRIRIVPVRCGLLYGLRDVTRVSPKAWEFDGNTTSITILLT